MRVAFDVDGVVADLRSVLVREAEVLFGRALSIAPDVDEDHPLEGLNHRERQRLWRRIATIENFWETPGETEEGAVARIAAGASTRRWEVLFLTKRPATAGAAAQTQTQRWLPAKGVPLPAVSVVRRSRGGGRDSKNEGGLGPRPVQALELIAEQRRQRDFGRREGDRRIRPHRPKGGLARRPPSNLIHRHRDVGARRGHE